MNDDYNTSFHKKSGTVGFGAGYNLVAKENGRLQITTETGSTFFIDNDWNFFYYDIGCRLYIGELDNRANAIVGLGLRQYFPDRYSVMP